MGGDFPMNASREMMCSLLVWFLFNKQTIVVNIRNVSILSSVSMN